MLHVNAFTLSVKERKKKQARFLSALLQVPQLFETVIHPKVVASGLQQDDSLRGKQVSKHRFTLISVEITLLDCQTEEGREVRQLLSDSAYLSLFELKIVPGHVLF